MRIVAGIYRGIRLDEVENKTTRPTTDKNKEMLFNILGQFFDGGRALDLFSGSGALGIEALSRGIKEVTFVEHDPLAVSTIKKNLSRLKDLDCKMNVIKQDVLSYIKGCTSIPYDLILVDPPYHLEVVEELLSIISTNKLLSIEGILVLEADKNRVIHSPIEDLKIFRERITGNTKFFFIRREH